MEAVRQKAVRYPDSLLQKEEASAGRTAREEPFA
jgi:hypothetical protein